MPHIPRAFASTSGVTPELLAAPRQPRSESKPPPPVAFRGVEERKTGTAPRTRLIGRISLFKHDVPIERVYKALTGHEVTKDEFTRQLLRKRTRAT